MLHYLDGFIKRLRDGIKSSSSYPYRKITYSQEGEDLILMEVLDQVSSGFYVDVGAFHPFKHSNTMLLHTNGWSGLNIDAMPGSMRLFDKFRPNDINIESVVSSRIGVTEYYRFQKSDLNTIDAQEAVHKQKLGFKLESVEKVSTTTLTNILEEFNIKNIDVLNIDVENHELEVLKGLNFKKFTPKFILVEILRRNDIRIIDESEVAKYLSDRKYVPFAKTSRTAIFRYE